MTGKGIDNPQKGKIFSTFSYMSDRDLSFLFFVLTHWLLLSDVGLYRTYTKNTTLVGEGNRMGIFSHRLIFILVMA